MTLSKKITTFGKPSTEKEVRSYFIDDERIKSKRLKSFEVTFDNLDKRMDSHNSYYNLYADHYNLTAVFE